MTVRYVTIEQTESLNKEMNNNTEQWECEIKSRNNFHRIIVNLSQNTTTFFALFTIHVITIVS